MERKTPTRAGRATKIVKRQERLATLEMEAEQFRLTERKESEAARALSQRENEASLRELLESLPQLFWTCRADGPCDYLSRQWIEYTGVPEADQLGYAWLERLHPDDRQRVMAEWGQSAASGAPFDIEFRIRRNDGVYRWFKTRATPLRDASGQLVKWLGSNTDIDDLKVAEAELLAHRDHLDELVEERTAEARKIASELEIIIDAIPGLVFYKDAENHFLRVNRYVADAYGMPKAAMAGKDIADLHSPEQAKAYWDDDLQVIRSGKPKLNIDEPWQTESGMRWVSTSKIPYVDETGKTVGVIGVSLDVTERKLAEEKIRSQSWLKTGQGAINDVVRGDKEIGELTSGLMSCVSKHADVPVGALYLNDGGGSLRLVAGYAHDRSFEADRSVFAIGQGLVGQAAAERKTLRIREIPADSVKLVSGLVTIVPVELLYLPLVLNNEVMGVLEIGAFQPLPDRSVEFLESVAESIAAALNSSELRARRRMLLHESQRLTEELQSQQEELRASNEELEEQTRRLTESQERLRAQQEEMEVTNEELKDKNQLLEQQKSDVEAARRQIQEKAEEVALASRYKSEFLANMSHELRTPLNSLLLLAQSLSENRGGNLTPEQVEAARIIQGGGTELLNLINEVLDLAKIEAGRMDLRPARTLVSSLGLNVEHAFRHVAHEKGLSLEVCVSEDAPAEIVTDQQRVEQVLRNLVGNALKFTESGGVTVTLGRPAAGVDLYRSGMDASGALAIAVNDTGIGVAPENQKIIFEAFHQGDGGTSRQYGGTGLGLSISRELAQLLCGEIQLESQPGKGSTFTLFLPLELVPRPPKPAEVRPRSADAGSGGTRSGVPAVQASGAPVGEQRPESAEAPAATIPDDRDAIEAHDTVILVIEDDLAFAKVLVETCHERGFKCLAAPTGDAGLELARRRLPSGILLDLRLPGLDGWSVLGALKDDLRTRHIPVHVVSAVEASAESLSKGAIGHVTKPITREQLDLALSKLERTAAETVKRVLLVEDDPQMRQNVKALIGNGDVKLDEAASGQEAIEAMRVASYSCVILDLGLPDMDGKELLTRLQAEGVDLPPVIVHTARALTDREEMELREYAQSIVIKDVRSQERLLDEVSLFLHRVVSRMPEKKRQMIRDLHETDALLRDKKVLLVDDDMRTTFAVSRLLSERGLRPIKAANGQQALDALDADPGIDLVLMDIMMPQMDGYEAMRRIRAQERFRRLPILALTAKAMPEDRQKCIDAGANDYLPKPLDSERLISLLRVWLYR